MRRLSIFLALAALIGCSSSLPPVNPHKEGRLAPGVDPSLDLYREIIQARSRRALVQPARADDPARQDLVWALMGSILSIPDTGQKPPVKIIQDTLEGHNLDLLDHVQGIHDRKALTLALINADLAASDPHAQYLPPVAVDTLDRRLRLFDEGLGIMVIEDVHGKVVVSAVSEGSPASKVKGLSEGSVLSRMKNDKGQWYSPKGEAQWRQALSGEAGTTAGLEWVDSTGVRHSAQLRRTLWSIESQRARARIINTAAGRVAIVSVPAFYDRSPDVGTLPDIASAVKIARVGAAEIMVLDLRGNRGGEWRTVIDTAGILMPGGLLANAVGSLDRPLPVTAPPHEQAWRAPIWVWVDQHTASGGEILAGSLRESVGACIVGERTFGKATMQERIDIKPPHGGQVLLSTTLYTWPSGKTAQWTGVEPDMWMTDPAVHSAVGERSYPSAMVPFSRDLASVSPVRAAAAVDDDDWIEASIGTSQCKRP